MALQQPPVHIIADDDPQDDPEIAIADWIDQNGATPPPASSSQSR